MKKLRLAVCTLAIVFLALPGLAQAVENGGVGGRPAHPRPDNPRTQSIFVFTLKPGQKTTDAVKLINNTSKKVTLSVYPVDSQISSGGAFACAQKADERKGVGSWITLSQDSVAVPAHGTVDVPFTIVAPKKADTGEHDGCIAIQDDSQTKTTDNQSGVVLGFRSAIRVAVTIPGKITKQLKLESVSVSRLRDDNYAVTPTVKNTGNVSLDTAVDAQLAGWFGPASDSAKGTYPVLPDSTSSWNFEFKQPFWGGWYHATAKVSYYDSPRASLGLVKGNKKTLTMSSGMFFAPPKPLAAAIEALVVLIIIGLIVWWLLRRRRARHVRRHWRIYTLKEGDTLVNIAERLKMPWQKLAKANKLKPPYHLEPGQKLRVPAPKAKNKE